MKSVWRCGKVCCESDVSPPWLDRALADSINSTIVWIRGEEYDGNNNSISCWHNDSISFSLSLWDAFTGVSAQVIYRSIYRFSDEISVMSQSSDLLKIPKSENSQYELEYSSLQDLSCSPNSFYSSIPTVWQLLTQLWFFLKSLKLAYSKCSKINTIMIKI